MCLHLLQEIVFQCLLVSLLVEKISVEISVFSKKISLYFPLLKRGNIASFSSLLQYPNNNFPNE